MQYSERYAVSSGKDGWMENDSEVEKRRDEIERSSILVIICVRHTSLSEAHFHSPANQEGRDCASEHIFSEINQVRDPV